MSDSDKKDKAGKFKKVAAGRVTKAVQAIRLLGKCANTKEYEYTRAESLTVVNEVFKELDKIREQFLNYAAEDAYEFCFETMPTATPLTATDDEAETQKIGGRE